MVDLRAVAERIRPIVNRSVGIRSILDQADVERPFDGPRRPVAVGSISGKACESGRQCNEVARAQRVPVGVAVVEREDLPAKAAIAGARVPARRLVIEYVLC